MINLIDTFKVFLLLTCLAVTFFCEGSVTTYRVSSVKELKEAVHQINLLPTSLPVEVILAAVSYTHLTLPTICSV